MELEKAAPVTNKEFLSFRATRNRLLLSSYARMFSEDILACEGQEGEGNL